MNVFCDSVPPNELSFFGNGRVLKVKTSYLCSSKNSKKVSGP